jgi:hypothetical protein
MLEVDSVDDRPVIFRRPNASTTQPIVLALAGGKEGTAADAENTLGLIKATAIATEGRPARSRVEIQTNRGKRLATDWVLPVPAVQVSRTSAQQIVSGELVALSFDREVYDNDGMHDGANARRLTCVTPGKYAVSAVVEFAAANGKGSRQVVVRRNGTQEVAAMRIPAVDGDTTQITFTAPLIELNDGDYVELLVRQTSGQPLQIPAGGSPAVSFGMTRAG